VEEKVVANFSLKSLSYMEVCGYVYAPTALALDKGSLVFIDQNIEYTPEAAETAFWRTEKFLALSDIE
jgi:hypothetical protein